MADQKISDLSAGGDIQDTDKLVGARGASNVSYLGTAFLRPQNDLSDVSNLTTALGNLGLATTSNVTFNMLSLTAGLSVGTSITVGGTVDGVDIAALKTDVDGFPDALKNLSTFMIEQVENINASTISPSQWGYLSNQNQDVSSSNDVEFNSLTTFTNSVDGVDIPALKTDVDGFPDALKNLTAAEIGELENIGTTTINATQWGYVGSTDQGVSTSDNVSFGGVTISDASDPQTLVVESSGSNGTSRLSLKEASNYGLILEYDGNANIGHLIVNNNGVESDVMDITRSTGNVKFQYYVDFVNHPLVEAYLSSDALNVTGDGTNYSVVFDSETVDRNSNFNTSTGTFTAPTNGYYMVTARVKLDGIGSGHTFANLTINSSNRRYVQTLPSPAAVKNSSNDAAFTISQIVDMDTSDTFTIDINVFNSTKTVDIDGHASQNPTAVSVYLLTQF